MDGPRLLRWDDPDGAGRRPSWAGPGWDAAVTTRAGGVSAGPYRSLNLSFAVGDDPANVRENRRRLAGTFGAGAGDFVWARQVHGTGVAVVTGADRGRGARGADDAVPDSDALVTREPGLVLAILAADCVPVVLYDPVARVLGCVHAGWRGTAAGTVTEAVTVMRDLGAVPERMLAGIGPAIAAERYQVGPEVAEALGAAFPDGPVPRPDPAVPGRWLADLRAANRLRLLTAGLAVQNVRMTQETTGGRFFSDRAVRPCGRLALIARIGAPGREPRVRDPGPGSQEPERRFPVQGKGMTRVTGGASQGDGGQ